MTQTPLAAHSTAAVAVVSAAEQAAGCPSPAEQRWSGQAEVDLS